MADLAIKWPGRDCRSRRGSRAITLIDLYYVQQM
jgi:hypothetical protein